MLTFANLLRWVKVIKLMQIIKKYITNKFQSFKFTIITLLTIIVIMFLLITYGIIQSTLNNFTARAHTRAQVIENAVYSSIANANQVIYGLAMALAHEPIGPNNHYIVRLLKSFDSKLDRYKTIPFSALKLLDYNDQLCCLIIF